MALSDNWYTFIKFNGGEAGARDMFEKVMDELLRAENPGKEVHLVRAAQGDGGIDVYVHQANGIDVYQCKFFMGGDELFALDPGKRFLRSGYRVF